ncbi:MAG: hypothetical protein M3Q46_10580 [Verrucomicrobiota bacterium]|nr:hypothetical protein [Verrucomicrobiota bacterium]
MNAPGPNQIGYAFALPRLVARLAGRQVRRAELSRWEAYGTGILVFAIPCVFAARLFLPLVRHLALQLLFVVLLPFAVWIAFLLVYFINARIAALLRRLGLFSAPTNNPLQHVVIISMVTLLAALLLRDPSDWINSLGALWLGLIGLNLLSLLCLKFRHET